MLLHPRVASELMSMRTTLSCSRLKAPTCSGHSVFLSFPLLSVARASINFQEVEVGGGLDGARKPTFCFYASRKKVWPIQ